MSAVFDQLAGDYDRTFTDSVVGRAQRRAVSRRWRARFASGDRVVELGCGTGEDAVAMARFGITVVATDPSGAMLEIAQRKAETAGVSEKVTFRPLAAESIETVAGSSTFDGAWSNFGALNLTADLDIVGAQLARLVRPGGVALLCFLGRWVPWEWLWYLSRLEPRCAFRRLRPGGAAWRGATVRYPPLRQIRHIFRPHWKTLRVTGVGILIPPSYAETWAARHEALIDRLARIEASIAAVPPFDRLGDHFLIELERR